MADEEHVDVRRARELIWVTIWSPSLLHELESLVKRNELKGSPLGYDRYVIMRDLLIAAKRFFEQLVTTRQELVDFEHGSVIREDEQLD